MKKSKGLLIICIAIPLLVGFFSALLTRQSMATFATLNKPPLSPPGILFPIVWTILYTLMGIGSYLVLTSDGSEKDMQQAFVVYGIQLAVNFLWSTFFFNFGWYLFSLLWLVLLWVLIFIMLKRFYEVSKVAAYINIPYLLWVTFAGYLNLGIYLLN